MSGVTLPFANIELPTSIAYPLILLALWSLAGRLYPFFRLLLSFRPAPDLPLRYGRKSYALITGAASPLGSEFSHRLAAAGYNLILLGRKEAEIRSLAGTIESKYSVSVTVIHCEVANRGPDLQQFYDNVFQSIAGLDVSLVVNNFGMVEDGFFEGQSPSIQAKTLDINIWPSLMLTRWAIERMSGRADRSAIVNVGSITGLYPYAGMGLSSATMKFADFLLVSLANEFKLDPQISGKIDVLSVRPSELWDDTGKNRAKTTAKECVDGVLRNLGAGSYTAGAWKHSLLTAFLSVFPEKMKESAMVTRLKQGGRRREIKDKEQ